MIHRSGLVALALVCCACSEKARVEKQNRQWAESARDARSKPEYMRWIPGGEFRMGSEKPNEGPVHSVTVAEKAPTREEFPGAPPEKLVPGALVFTGTEGAVRLDDYTRPGLARGRRIPEPVRVRREISQSRTRIVAVKRGQK